MAIDGVVSRRDVSVFRPAAAVLDSVREAEAMSGDWEGMVELLARAR